MDYDEIRDKAKLARLSNDEVLELVQQEFPEKALYSISTGWRHGDYILKARGLQGDAIIGWS